MDASIGKIQRWPLDPSECLACGRKRRWLELFSSADWHCDHCAGDKPEEPSSGTKTLRNSDANPESKWSWPFILK